MERFMDALLRLPFLNRMEREEAVKLIWYTVIGVITYGINNILLFTFRRVIRQDVISVALSFFLTNMCHFVLHNKITFKQSAESTQRKIMGYLAVVIVNYAAGVTVTTLILKFVIDNNFIATACSSGTTLLIGYFLLNNFVYKLHTERRKILK